MDPGTRAPAGTHRTVVLLFGGWFGAVLLLGAALTVLHSATLPAPRVGTAEAGRWRAVHVVAEDCACSSYVAERLAARGRQAPWEEQVLVIGEGRSGDAALVAAGFAVRHVTPVQAAGEGFEGAPWLLLRDPAGKVVYSGGYSSVRPSPGHDLMDTVLMAAVRSGRHVSALPAFGCATSMRLRQQLDPLHLKY